MEKLFFLICAMSVAVCKLKIIRPPSLAQDVGSEIKYSVSNFGVIPWGHRIMGTVDVAYPDQGCEYLTPTMGSQFILIRRGNCTFVTKVRNAENAGYKFAIIGDNNYNTNFDEFIMVDDGTGYSVTIPSVFIQKQDFEKLYQVATQNQVQSSNDEKIFMLMKFDVKKSESVSVIFALNVQDGQTYLVLNQFEEYYFSLKGSDINYTLIYPLYNMTIFEKLKEDISSNCIANGRYCTFDPDGAGVATGGNVIDEIIRQTCIFELFPDNWFRYLDEFRDSCTKPQDYLGCSRKTQIKTKIKPEDIQKCYMDSFIDPDTKQPTLNHSAAILPMLDYQIDLIASAGIRGLPSVVINGQTFQGEMTGKAIFGDICNSFSSPPQTCSTEIEGYIPPPVDDSTEYILAAIIFLVALFVVFIVVLFFLYKKLIKRDVDQDTQPQVNEMVSQYIKFYEGKDKQKLSSV